MASLPSLPNGPNPSLCSPSLLRHCRSASDLGAEADSRGPFKFARMDTFPARHIDLESQMNARAIPSALMYGSSGRSEGHLNNFSTNTVASNGFLRSYNLSSLQGRPSRADDVGSLVQNFAGGPQSSSARAGSSPFQDYMLNQVPSSRTDGARTTASGISGPFTAEQWLEFSQQIYVFKHLAAGVKPPPALLLPMVSSVSTTNRYGVNLMHTGSNAAGFSSGAQGSTDPEPGRCRRTDGKKWRCARDVVQDQKYCERHMHRGRHRSRAKNGETQSAATQSIGGLVTSASNAPNASVATSTTTTVEKSACGISLTAGRLVSLSPQVVSAAAASDSQPQPFTAVVSLGLPSSVPPKAAQPSSSQLALSRESRLQFSLHPSGASVDATRGDLRSVSSSVCPNHTLTSDTAELNRLLQGGQGVGNMRNLLAAKMLTAEQTNVAAFKESIPSSMFGMSHVRNHLDVEDAAKAHHVSHVFASASEIGWLNGERETDDLPFRQYMNDWPRSRESPSLSWCDLDEQQNSSKTASSTELSVSNHMVMNLPFASLASTRLKPSSSPLRLSIMKAGGEDDLLGESVDMGLSMGVGVASADELRDRQQSNCVPIAWDTPLVGGPLAEVLHSSSSTPRGHSSGSLNLLGEAWDHHHHHHLQPGSPKESNSASLASPTGVLHKTMFGSYADSSSSGSSPRSAPKMDSRFCDSM